MKEQTISYITAIINIFDRTPGMISTAVINDHLHDLLDFVQDLPEEPVIVTYNDEGSDGMDDWFDRITNNDLN